MGIIKYIDHQLHSRCTPFALYFVAAVLKNWNCPVCHFSTWILLWRYNRFQAHKCKLPRRTCTLFSIQKLGQGDHILPKHQKSYRKQTCRYLAEPVWSFWLRLTTAAMHTLKDPAFTSSWGFFSDQSLWSVWIQQFVNCISRQMFCKSVTMRYEALPRWCFWEIVLLRIWQQWLDVKPETCSKMLLLISCLHKKGRETSYEWFKQSSEKTAYTFIRETFLFATLKKDHHKKWLDVPTNQDSFSFMRCVQVSWQTFKM